MVARHVGGSRRVDLAGVVEGDRRVGGVGSVRGVRMLVGVFYADVMANKVPVAIEKCFFASN